MTQHFSVWIITCLWLFLCPYGGNAEPLSREDQWVVQIKDGSIEAAEKLALKHGFRDAMHVMDDYFLLKGSHQAHLRRRRDVEKNLQSDPQVRS